MKLSSNAIDYVLKQLAYRAGIGDTLSDSCCFADVGVKIYYQQPKNISHDHRSITIVPCSESAWDSLLMLEPGSLEWQAKKVTVPHRVESSNDDPIPIIIWGDGLHAKNKPFAEQINDVSVVCYVDIIATTLFMLSRWEETVIPIRDQHSRFPATASVAYKQGFLGRPIVDEYALILREWLKTLVPGWTPKKRSFTVKLSHDIDQVRHFKRYQDSFRTLIGDVLRRKNFPLAINTIKKIIEDINPNNTTQLNGIRYLASLSNEYGLESAFYFMSAMRTQHDNGYDVNSKPVKRVIKELMGHGFEIGLHPGYWTLGDPDKLAVEKSQLDSVLGNSAYGGRQHYLRFSVPDTWRHWEQAGLLYDSTVGYADHEGFRAGTCHPYHPFDLEEDRELDLLEIPLIVMDGTLRDYRNLTPEQSKKRILELARRCQSVEGMFTLLWHNTSLNGTWAPWAHVYTEILKELASL